MNHPNTHFTEKTGNLFQMLSYHSADETVRSFPYKRSYHHIQKKIQQCSVLESLENYALL